LKLDDKIARWEENFNTPEEFIESEREWRRMLNKLYNQIDKSTENTSKTNTPKLKTYVNTKENKLSRKRGNNHSVFLFSFPQFF